MERDLTWREAAAAGMLLLAVAAWGYLASLETVPFRRAAWLLGGAALLFAAWGVIRRLERVTEAVWRSVMIMTVVLVILLFLPLRGPDGRPTTFRGRVGPLAPVLLWCAVTAALLSRPRPLPEAPPKERQRTSSSPKRRRRRRHRKRRRKR